MDEKRFLTIKGKNLMKYDIVYCIPEGGGVAIGKYEAEPTMLSGGAQLPISFFRDPLINEILPGDEEGN